MTRSLLIMMIFHFSLCECISFVNNENRYLCEVSSKIQINATLKGGMRNKRIKYLGKRTTWVDCSEMVCGIHDADYAFMLLDYCYAVTCLTPCDVIKSDQSEETRLISIKRKAFLSNEHRVINEVFRSFGDTDIRPRATKRAKIKVGLNIRLIQILDVDAVGQAIKLNVWTTQEWENPMQSWESRNYGNTSQVNVEPNMIWTPVLMLYNNADNSMGNLKTLKTKVIVNNTGYNTWFASTSMKASCKINVKYFPFDQQICRLTFGSWTNTMDEMEVAPFGQETGLQHFIKNAEWDVMTFKAEQRVIRHACCTEPFAEVVYHLRLKRKTLYYMYTLVVPVTTITSLIAIGFCLPPNSGERIILSVTVLVSMTVYLNIASKRLPATSDNIPLLSLFYLMLFVQISLSLAASTYVLANFYRQNFSKPMPSWFKWLIFDNLGGLLCGMKLKRSMPISPRTRQHQQRKTVRFSDIITINGSATSLSSKGSRKLPNGTAKGVGVTASAKHDKYNTSTDKKLSSKTNNATSANCASNANRAGNANCAGNANRSGNANCASTIHNTSNAKSQTKMNGSANLNEVTADDRINLYENMFEDKIVEEFGKRQTQQLICEQIDVLTADVYEQEKKKETVLEWQYASAIIDRAFFFAFVFTLVLALSFFLLHKIPYLSGDNTR